MKILFVTARCPFPARNGDALIAAAQLERLAARHELHLAWLAGEGTPGPWRSLVATATSLGVVTSRRRALAGWTRATPALVGMYRSTHATAALRALFDRIGPDLVHVQTVHAAEHARRLPGPKVLDLVDSMAANMETRATAGPVWRRPAFLVEAKLLARYERAVARDYDRLVLASAAEASRFPGAHVRVNENGTALRAVDVAREARVLVLHGNMSYAPNVDAAEVLAREILPSLAMPAVRLRIVGRDPVPRVRALHDGRAVFVVGAVDDVAAELSRATLAVQPVRLGSGVPNKLLEAMACGAPAVTSTRAVAGLPGIVDGEHVLVADGVRATSDAIRALLGDPSRCARLARNARALVDERFTWAKNVARLEAAWAEAVSLEGHRAPRQGTAAPSKRQ